MNPWTVTIVALVAIGVLGVVGIALAQSALPAPRVNFDEASVPNTTPVVVALTNDLPSKLDIVIRRRATITPHDVILVRPSALQADLIAEAVETLQATRRGSGRLPNHDASF